MPQSPASPSRLRAVRQLHNRPGSSLANPASGRVGKRSSSEGLVGPLPALKSKRAANTDENHGATHTAAAGEQIGIQTLDDTSTAHKRHRVATTSCEIQASGPQIVHVSRMPLQRTASGIRPPSVHATKIPSQAMPRTRVGSYRPATSVQQQHLPGNDGDPGPRAPRRISSSSISAKGRGSLQFMTSQVSCRTPHVLSDPAPVSQAEFTFQASKAQVKRQPLSRCTSDSLQNVDGLKPRLADLAHQRPPTSLARRVICDPPGNNRCASSPVTRISQPLSTLCQVPCRTPPAANGSTVVVSTRRRSSMALNDTHKILDTPAARERGLRRLGSLMLLPGVHSAVEPATSVARADLLEKNEAESRCSTPTQRDYLLNMHTPSHTVEGISRPPSLETLSISSSRTARRSSFDQTCATLAALSVNEETMLVGDDALLVDLCTESSRIDKNPDEGVGERMRGAQSNKGEGSSDDCAFVATRKGIMAAQISDLVPPSRGNDAIFFKSVELRDKVNELTGALSDEVSGRSADVAKLTEDNTALLEVITSLRGHVRELEAKVIQREEAIAIKDSKMKELQAVGGRVLVGDAVAGYDGLLRAINTEMDVVKGESDLCLVLSRTLALLSRAL